MHNLSMACKVRLRHIFVIFYITYLRLNKYGCGRFFDVRSGVEIFPVFASSRGGEWSGVQAAYHQTMM